MSTTTEQKSSYDREDLLACAHGELFGPGNARLPLPNMLMMGATPSASEPVVLIELMYIDPEQFAQSDASAASSSS